MDQQQVQQWIAQAKEAGYKRTQSVNEALHEAFEFWLNDVGMEALCGSEENDDAYDLLFDAFQEGFSRYMHQLATVDTVLNNQTA